ncbi:MAG: hypothetical protein WCX61_01695 [Candidatus Peribacteraceae bacterium]|jgi:hypothetical protein
MSSGLSSHRPSSVTGEQDPQIDGDQSDDLWKRAEALLQLSDEEGAELVGRMLKRNDQQIVESHWNAAEQQLHALCQWALNHGRINKQDAAIQPTLIRIIAIDQETQQRVVFVLSRKDGNEGKE